MIFLVKRLSPASYNSCVTHIQVNGCTEDEEVDNTILALTMLMISRMCHHYWYEKHGIYFATK